MSSSMAVVLIHDLLFSSSGQRFLRSLKTSETLFILSKKSEFKVILNEIKQKHGVVDYRQLIDHDSRPRFCFLDLDILNYVVRACQVCSSEYPQNLHGGCSSALSRYWVYINRPCRIYSSRVCHSFNIVIIIA